MKRGKIWYFIDRHCNESEKVIVALIMTMFATLTPILLILYIMENM